jgi:hypothetical protein
MIMCAKCRHEVESAIQIRNGFGSWIDVTCHGSTVRMADDGNDRLPMLAFVN